jgi:triosephosphate isomerase
MSTRDFPEPFFEIGPKTYLRRRQLLEVAESANQASIETGVAVIITAPLLDIEIIKAAQPGLWVFAQHMDPERPGRSVGTVAPEALRDVGTDGVMLNHFERHLTAEVLEASIARAREVGLLTLVCADTVADSTRIALHHPDIILAEPPELIGTRSVGPRPWIPRFNRAVATVDPRIRVMHAGGIGSPDDVRAVIRQGASGTGVTTAIVDSEAPGVLAREMIRAVSAGRRERDARLANLEQKEATNT